MVLFGDCSLIWGSASWNHKSAFVVIEGTLTGRRYRDEILESVAIPFGMESIGPGFLYQDVNARLHQALVVTDFHK